MKEFGSRLVTVVNGIPSLVVKLTHAFLLLLLVVLVWRNYGYLEKFFQRTLQESRELVIAGLFSVKTEPIRVASPSSGSSIEQWATSDRVAGSLVVTLVGFDDQDGRRSEYFEVVTRDWVNLGGGYVGDDNELLPFDAAEIRLAPTDCLRIYTYVVPGSRPEGGCSRSVDVHRLDSKDAEPIFRPPPQNLWVSEP